MDGKESVEIHSRDQATINILPDDALLEIFHFYRDEVEYAQWWWKNLTDVCRRWRHIVFASPHRLNLKLVCTERTPTRTSLDIWPPFPLTIDCSPRELDEESQDNIIAALEHRDRVIGINIENQKCLGLEKFTAATRMLFPVLSDIRLSSLDDIAPVLHEEFLGGSAPRLRTFIFSNIVFPAFPRLASFAPHLSRLELHIPIAGYISPEAMATCLAALPSLRWLYIGLRFYSDRINLSPPTRAVLPALSHFSFQGISEYLEELVARIDTPKLFHLNIVIDLIYNIPQLCKFIARTEAMRPLSPAEIVFSSSYTDIRLGPHYGVVMLRISCEGSDWQASSMARVCSQLSPLLSHVERLDIREHPPQENAIEKNAIDPSRWFDIFDPFSAVQRLYLYDELRPLVALALQVLIGERATEMLPTLRSLYLKGPPPSRSTREDIQLFIAARQHSNYPVDVHWE